jgi:peptide methionine sulfoxide reductase msrA/msrB
MLKWLDVIKYANKGNPAPDKRVEKTEDEWRQILTDEQFYITRQKGTERAHSSDLCTFFEAGQYACVCCDTLLFDSAEKYDSGTGWPSFTQPVKENVIAYFKDKSHGMYRVETTCNTCDAHLGHVFQDGPMPSGLRYCMNAIALKKVENNIKKATFGGGCFWCTEAIFQNLKGIIKVESGFSGGRIHNPTYREVTSGITGHAEVINFSYNPDEILYEELVKIHLTTHDPTTLNKQGADAGTQYRSVIFYRNEEEKAIALKVIKELKSSFDDMIVTEVAVFEQFYPADDYHQNYYNDNKDNNRYCTAVINPKLKKFKELYNDKLNYK